MSFERDDDTAGASYAVTTPAVPKDGGGFSALPRTVPGIDTNEGRALAAFDALATGSPDWTARPNPDLACGRLCSIRIRARPALSTPASRLSRPRTHSVRPK